GPAMDGLAEAVAAVLGHALTIATSAASTPPRAVGQPGNKLKTQVSMDVDEADGNPSAHILPSLKAILAQRATGAAAFAGRWDPHLAVAAAAKHTAQNSERCVTTHIAQTFGQKALQHLRSGVWSRDINIGERASQVPRRLNACLPHFQSTLARFQYDNW